MDNILITICARGGSKGIPGKNIRPLNGLPLIVYSIKHALDFEKIFPADLVVSSDDQKILSIASDFEVKNLHERGHLLSTDTAGKVDVILEVLDYMESKTQKKYDYLLDLDVTSPLRNLEDLLQGLEILRNSQGINLFSVNVADRNPYFNMVEEGDDGFFKLSKKISSHITTRQSAPVVYALNASFYWYKRIFFQKRLKSVITDRSLVYKMPHICFDLDHPIDFEFMEFLVSNNKLTWFN